MRTMTITIERTPITLQFCDRPIEVEELSVRLPFARKADNLREMTSYGNAVVYVTETVEMTAHEFDDFASSFPRPRPWLKGKGGSHGDGHLCVEIRAPGRPYLYVDPSGGDCARYVARLG
jgi:hypothetical protein